MRGEVGALAGVGLSCPRQRERAREAYVCVAANAASPSLRWEGCVRACSVSLCSNKHHYCQGGAIAVNASRTSWYARGSGGVRRRAAACGVRLRAAACGCVRLRAAACGCVRRRAAA